MKIAVVTTFYSEGMGYTENCLPKALVELGHEVDVITSNLNVYGNDEDYKETYEAFLGEADQGTGVRCVMATQSTGSNPTGWEATFIFEDWRRRFGRWSRKSFIARKSHLSTHFNSPPYTSSWAFGFSRKRTNICRSFVPI